MDEFILPYCDVPFSIVVLVGISRVVNDFRIRHHAFYCVLLVMMSEQGLMMASSNGNIFRVPGPLCGEFPGHWWIPRTKASDANLWCFLSSVPEYKRWSKQSWSWWRHRAHYDVIVMWWWHALVWWNFKENKRALSPFSMVRKFEYIFLMKITSSK